MFNRFLHIPLPTYNNLFSCSSHVCETVCVWHFFSGKFMTNALSKALCLSKAFVCLPFSYYTLVYGESLCEATQTWWFSVSPVHLFMPCSCLLLYWPIAIRDLFLVCECVRLWWWTCLTKPPKLSPTQVLQQPLEVQCDYKEMLLLVCLVFVLKAFTLHGLLPRKWSGKKKPFRSYLF